DRRRAWSNLQARAGSTSHAQPLTAAAAAPSSRAMRHHLSYARAGVSVTRRDFLRTVGSSAGVWLVTCGDNSHVLAGSAVLDADYDPSPEFASGMLEAVVAAAPDLVISIGDFPYTDNGPPAMTVPEYRARHAEVRCQPSVRAMLDAAGMYAIYDDHEVRN